MRAVIYARYSIHNQREESIEDQVRVCEAAARDAGDEVVAVFFDRAASGTTDRRPGFLGLVELSRRRGWQRVWAYKTDRFARNRYDAAAANRAVYTPLIQQTSRKFFQILYCNFIRLSV